MIIFNIGGWAFPQGQPSCRDEFNNKLLIPGPQNSSICKLATVIEQGVNDLRFLVGFILSGFLASSVGMWLARRNAYRGARGATT
jgi:hypothetical protein